MGQSAQSACDSPQRSAEFEGLEVSLSVPLQWNRQSLNQCHQTLCVVLRHWECDRPAAHLEKSQHRRQYLDVSLWPAECTWIQVQCSKWTKFQHASQYNNVVKVFQCCQSCALLISCRVAFAETPRVSYGSWITAVADLFQYKTRDTKEDGRCTLRPQDKWSPKQSWPQNPKSTRCFWKKKWGSKVWNLKPLDIAKSPAMCTGTTIATQTEFKAKRNCSRRAVQTSGSSFVCSTFICVHYGMFEGAYTCAYIHAVCVCCICVVYIIYVCM